MIRTDIDIKDLLYGRLKDAEISGEVSGGLYKDARPINSELEDITISVLARDAGPQIQEAIVNVNVYVPDVRRGQEAIENTQRLRTLARLCAQELEYAQTGDMIMSLDSQEIMKVQGVDFHVINNRMNIKFNNETK